MELPWKKKQEDVTEDDLLEEIKRKTADLPQLSGKPPLPPPIFKKPIADMPMPSFHPISKPPLMPPSQIEPDGAPALSTHEVAKLPLFMKVDEYDRIVSDVQTLVTSLETMSGILENLSRLEQEQRNETDKWREQLGTTRALLNRLLAHMPETGKLKTIVTERKKIQQKEKFRHEITGLQKELRHASAPVQKPPDQLSSEIQALHSNISGIQGDMRALHEELKNMAEQAKKAADEKAKQPSYNDMPLRPGYKKTDSKKPW